MGEIAGKQSKKKGLKLPIVMLLMFVFVIVFLSRFLIEKFDLTNYPVSTLSETPSKYLEPMADEELTLAIQPPNLSYQIMVPDNIKNSNDSSCNIIYNDDINIHVYATLESADSLLQGAIAKDCYGSSFYTGSKFANKLTDTGYSNSFKTSYYAGRLFVSDSLTNQKYYYVMYQMDTDSSDKLYVCISTQSKKSLYEAKDVLDRVYGSVIEINGDVEQSVDEETNTKDSTTVSENNVVSRDEFNKMVEDGLMDTGVDGAVPSKATSTMEVNIPEGQVVNYFQLTYANVMITPTLAKLISPDGTEYKPFNLNNDNFGEVWFRLADGASSGKWQIYLEGNLNENIGQYTINCYSEKEYKEYLNPQDPDYVPLEDDMATEEGTEAE